LFSTCEGDTLRQKMKKQFLKMTKKKNPVPSTRSRAQCSVERLDGWDKSTRPSGTPTGRWISGQAHYQLLPQHWDLNSKDSINILSLVKKLKSFKVFIYNFSSFHTYVHGKYFTGLFSMYSIPFMIHYLWCWWMSY
jgi:hypothetical protein